MMDMEQQTKTLTLVGKLIKTLSSPEVAVDEVHTPKLYARFLEGLLLKRNQEVAGGDTKKPEPVAKADPPRPPPPINTSIIQESHRSKDGLMSPTIQVEAPLDDQIPASFAALQSLNAHPTQGQDHQMLGGGINEYAYSTSGASTIDGMSHTATHFSHEDVIMGAADENWIATMGAIDNPMFWNNAMVSPPSPCL